MGDDAEALERARTAAIAAYGVLEERFGHLDDLQTLVALAAAECGVPMATLNLITETEQHQVASVGFEGGVSARADSMCAVVLDDDRPVVLADASLDERYADNPWVTGDAHVRFYATFQLRTPDAVPIGTLCMFDSVAHPVEHIEQTRVAELAARVVQVLELELRTRELDQTVRRLNQAHEQLRLANENLAAFAGQVSHDLRNPLASLSMSLGLLQDMLDEDVTPPVEQLASVAARAVNATQRMAALVDAVFGYSTGAAVDLEGEVDLAAVMAEVREDVAAQLGDGELTVAPLPTVPGDAVRLRQVLQNLVSNALKFVEPGTLPRVCVQAERVGDRWRIEVHDNGIGISGDEHVFEPFARAESAASYDGAGLGLATCRAIVNAHDGTIGLRPAPDGGTIAWFELPVS